MTRPIEEVHAVLELRREGLGARRISRLTGVPTKTVQGWVNDPERALLRPLQSGVDCHGSCEPWRDVDQRTYAYLLGMYLGDGTISTHPSAYRLRVFCDQKYPRIMDEVADAMFVVIGARAGRVRKVGCDEVYTYSCHWPCYFPQHGPGVKHQRPIVLAPWQREIVERYPRPFIRGLIHSDGWRGNNVAIKHTELAIEYRTYTRYHFTNKSDDIRDLFCWALDLIGVHWTRSNQWTISVARRKDVHYLDSFVGPKR